MSRRAIASLTVLLAWLALAPPAGAHRLDELLQATRVSIDADRISVEIDLTPGASLADHLFATVDSDHDGEVSDQEARAYARRVLASVTLAVDGRPAPVRLVDRRFPTLREMRLGLGTIHVSARAAVPPGAGLRHLSYVNGFLPESSVYLANTLLPSDESIHIEQQRRDFRQRGLAVEYRVGADRTSARIAWSLTLLAMIGMLVMARRGGASEVRERP